MIKYCDRCYELALTRIYANGLHNSKICYSKQCSWTKKKRARLNPRVLYRPKSLPLDPGIRDD